MKREHKDRKNEETKRTRKPTNDMESMIEKEKTNKKLVESFLDSTVQMAEEIAKKEGEIAIRLYLLQAVIENITLRQAFIKYKVQRTKSRDIPTEYTEGYPMIVKKVKDHQLYNIYEGYIKLVPRESFDELSIDWREIESDFIDFLLNINHYEQKRIT